MPPSQALNTQLTQNSQRGTGSASQKQGLANGIIGKRHDSMTIMNGLSSELPTYQ